MKNPVKTVRQEGRRRSAEVHGLIHEAEDENYQVKQMETMETTGDADKTLFVELVADESRVGAGC